MSDQTYQATIEGTISWDLIFNYDNSTNSGTIREKLTITTTKVLEYTTFKQSFNETIRKELEESHTGRVGASYEGVTAKLLEASTDISTEIADTLRETTSTMFKSNYSKTTTYERDVTVGPYSKLSLYQQRFSAPGLNVLGSAVSTNPPPSQTVTIQYVVRPIRFVSGIQVHYGDSPSWAPANRVLEYSSQNDDINADYGGEYVWLVPTYTYNASEAATRFDLFIQGNAHPGWDDLAKGAGGSFRYLQPVPDANNYSKITDLKLYRSDSGIAALPVPYTGHTNDINANRKKTFLYLIWSTATAY
ncbi:hypothetical protein BDY19DRAFT_689153 [Irpex rosettiformis]|uniref:Uncharacterized protein n=1 Tax=Irpex rosettiformis TaxID=378272 RepID=A0ACB8UA24_9APHY|nr:hypothetical protein BDY19DRAFT_689153 [Irpex rosettiformis]